MGKGTAEGCAACAKWCLIVFNVLFCLLGLGFIAAGVYVYVALREYLDFLGNENVNAPAIVLIVFGCITFVIAAIGCIGACKESPCLLFTFAIIIAVLVIAELAAGITAFIYRGKVEEWIRMEAPVLMKQYNSSNSDDGVFASWTVVQNQLECCGVNGASDWNNKTMAPANDAGIPNSCKSEDGATYDRGCVDAVKDFVEGNIYVVGGVGVAFAVIELMGIILACCVGCAARKGEYA